MFCPKCGNQVADGAGFCSKCGHKFEGAGSSPAGQANSRSAGATAAPGASVTSAIAPGASGLKLKPVGIVAVVFAVLAFIISLLPWFETSYYLLSVGGMASGAASLLGSQSMSSALAFDPEYCVWNLVGLAGTFSDYVSAFSSYGGSQAVGAASLITLFSWVCLLLWVVSVVFTVWGAITAFMKGSMGKLRVGSVFMAITAIVFYIFAAAMTTDTGTPTTMPAFCLIFSIVAFVLSFVAKGKKPQAN